MNDLGPIGLLWAFGAAVCWGVYIISGQSAGKRHGVKTAALGMLVAAVISLPFGGAELITAHLTMELIGMGGAGFWSSGACVRQVYD